MSKLELPAANFEEDTHSNSVEATGSELCSVCRPNSYGM